MPPIPPDPPERPVLPWTLAVGALLHVAVPLYLLACLGAALFGVSVASWSDLATLGLHTATWFLPAYVLLMLGAGLSAAAIDPALRRRRRRVRAPELLADASAARVARALASLASLRVDPIAAAVLDALRAARWDHRDPRDQALSGDLARAAQAFTAADASASAESRPELRRLAAAALERIAAAQAEAAAARGRLDEGDARTLASYLNSKYARGD